MGRLKRQTTTICIGNTDDKLPQTRWAAYCQAIKECLFANSIEIQFYGYSPTDAAWQNAAWVFLTESKTQRNNVQTQLTQIRTAYDQDSIAFVTGTTEFI